MHEIRQTSHVVSHASVMSQDSFSRVGDKPGYWTTGTSPRTVPNVCTPNYSSPPSTSHPWESMDQLFGPAATECVEQNHYTSVRAPETVASLPTQQFSAPQFSWSQPDCPQLDFAPLNGAAAKLDHASRETMLHAAHTTSLQMSEPAVWTMLGWKGRASTTGGHALPLLSTSHLVPPDRSHTNQSPSSASTANSSSSFGRFRSVPGNLVCYACHTSFTSQADLSHHMRSHQPYSSRKYGCNKCDRRFQYRKDLARHLPRHDPHRRRYYCPFASCKYQSKGFGRQDHLDRHIGSQHSNKSGNAS